MSSSPISEALGLADKGSGKVNKMVRIFWGLKRDGKNNWDNVDRG
jgi:hypothetical protein